MLVCPFCSKTNLRKKGFKRGKQQFKCKDCGRRTVSPLNSIADIDNNTQEILKRYKELNLDIPHPDFYNPKLIVENERKVTKLNQDFRQLDLKYKYLEKELEVEKNKNLVFGILEENKFERELVKVEPSFKNDNEATAVICLSDLHLEEDVNPVTINHLNEYNPKIAEKRFKKVFENALKLIRQQQNDIKINNIVLWLGGDLISNTIHEELMETNHLSPNRAILFADELITWGIDYLLNNTKCNVVIPTNHGNHGRSTEFMRIQTASDNSWEYLLYRNLERRYLKEKRIRFQIAEGYHNYLDVFGFKIRFHHGDSVRYNGGIGGIYIPVNKAIAEWDKSITANLDVLGHYHQLIFSGKFVCNGSLIGYNAFALSIKASPEPPQQAFFLVDKNRNRVTMRAPLFVD